MSTTLGVCWASPPEAYGSGGGTFARSGTVERVHLGESRGQRSFDHPRK
jgi:hypothetical protein